MSYDYDERLDLVDANDAVIGQVGRADYYRTDPKPGFLRAVNLFLVNSAGKIWVPRRAASQRIKPNALDFSAGGHVAAGETYEQSMRREAEEELGITIKPTKLLFIGTLPPADKPGRDYYFCSNYVYYSDETPRYSENEFSSHEWLLPEELAARLAAGEDAKESIRDALELLLHHQAQQSGQRQGH